MSRTYRRSWYNIRNTTKKNWDEQKHITERLSLSAEKAEPVADDGFGKIVYDHPYAMSNKTEHLNKKLTKRRRRLLDRKQVEEGLADHLFTTT